MRRVGQTRHRALKRNASQPSVGTFGRALLSSNPSSENEDTIDGASYTLALNDRTVEGKKQALLHVHSKVGVAPEILLCGCDLCRLQNVWCRVLRCGESKTKIYICAGCEVQLGILS